MNKITKENLLSAMHGEAFAFAKYMLFAERARRNGNTELAQLFENIAGQERLEHFAEQAELAELVGTDADNINDAINGESYEVETMYRDFAQQAEEVGEQAASDRFAEIRQDEMKHRDRFKAALAKLSGDSTRAA